MQKNISIKLLAAEAADDVHIKQACASALGCKAEDISGFVVLKKSMDARGKTIWVNLSLEVYLGAPFSGRHLSPVQFKTVHSATKSVVIIGAGPAGLFAALRCLQFGIMPIVIDRGKDVRTRRRDLALLNKTGEINPESNYCFGEGGAGTYSDGKLYTRSNKRGKIETILQLFVQFGATENILFEAHPHIGTNKLPQIISAMRQQIIDCGGTVLFEKKAVDFIITNSKISGIKTADGDTIHANAFVLATGHSARDIFELLHKKNLTIEAKPFALGVRVEHPQQLIDVCQYGVSNLQANHQVLQRPTYLPPAAYSLVQQVSGLGVFSFCMCPGGIIAPAATHAGQLVVNGWSPSKRNNPFANSGMVVECKAENVLPWLKNYAIQTSDDTAKAAINSALSFGPHHPLLMLYFQQAVERNAFAAGGGKFVAPAQRVVDFSSNRLSNSLPNCSYIPGVIPADLSQVLPGFIHQPLQEGFKAFGQKMRGYFTNEALVVATESRTSSPVKIPRDAITLTHPQVQNLYPCGEGAGYAGGIVSAAMDGEKVVDAIAVALGIEL